MMQDDSQVYSSLFVWKSQFSQDELKSIQMKLSTGFKMPKNKFHSNINLI